jgi:hypothetical protein
MEVIGAAVVADVFPMDVAIGVTARALVALSDGSAVQPIRTVLPLPLPPVSSRRMAASAPRSLPLRGPLRAQFPSLSWHLCSRSLLVGIRWRCLILKGITTPCTEFGLP